MNPSPQSRSPQTRRTNDAKANSGANTNEFKFEVLSEGLGFHPFSDGLPYAPVSKVNTATAPAQSRPAARDMNTGMGAGAIAAGPPRFTIPAAPAGLSPQPTRTVRQPITAASIPSAPIASVAANVAATLGNPPVSHAPRTLQTATPSAIAQSPTVQPQTAQPSTQLIVEDHPGFFILIKRMVAWTLDFGFTTMILAGAVSLLFDGTFPFDLDWMLRPEPFLMTILWVASTNWTLVTFQELFFRTTFGKFLLGMRVTGSAIERFLRSFFFVPSVAFLGLGLLWGLFNRQRRCWHDVAANAGVVEVTRL